MFYLGVFSLITMMQGCSPVSSGFSIPSTEEQFKGSIELNKKVDILFVVDNTSSMLQHQRRIAGQLGPLINELIKLKMDFRFAVTTTSMGLPTQSCPLTSRSLLGSPPYLTERNIQLLQERFIVGQSGCDTERGLDAMAHVISEKYQTESKTDFIRNDALLIVNFVTDEEDKSFEYAAGDSDQFVKLLNLKKPLFKDGSRGWIANFIGTLNAGVSCDQLGSPPSVGHRYLKLVETSQGIKSSICNLDMSTTVANIKARIVGVLTSFRFKEEPEKSTIEVTIGGTRIFESAQHGWSLVKEADTFILQFNGPSIPKADEQVSVMYKPARPR